MRGEYIYLRNGQPTDICEVWEVNPASSQRLIRSERRMIGATLSVSSVEANGLFARFDVRYKTSAIDIAAQYQLNERSIHVERIVNGQSATSSLIPETPFIVSPLMRIYTGSVIRQLAERGTPTAVLVPWLFDPTQLDRFLLPHFDTRCARWLAHADNADVYEYIGEQYDDTARFWVNRQDILTRYTWQQDDIFWEVKLIELDMDHGP